MWLEVATIIHRETKGAKSIDDFCKAFHGGENQGAEVKTYTFEQLVSALNEVAPFDWAAFFHERLDSTAAESPQGGIENGGWKVVFTSEPSRLGGRRGGIGFTYSLGLLVGGDGAVMDSLVGGPAFEAGISPGMKVIGVNGRVYTQGLLQDAVKDSANSKAPISLLVVNDDYISTHTINYHGGDRYPHLERVNDRPDYLDELIKARVGN
jgi:predicted metalloprotease with PDZ domain